MAIIQIAKPTLLSPAAASHQDALLPRHDAIAVAGVLAFSVISFGLSKLAGLALTPGLSGILIIPQFLGTLALIVHIMRLADKRIAQVLTYLTLWTLLPMAGAHLSYVGALLDMPMQTDRFSAIDHAMGFDWGSWGIFVTSNRFLNWATYHAYNSYSLQPYCALILVALFGECTRNARMIVAIMITVAITTLIGSLVPTYGAGLAYGIKMPCEEVLMALRAGVREGLPYSGVIGFPSFHAAQAVLYTAVYSRMKFCFAIAAALNAFMLLSVPLSGSHFLIDAIAGVLVALFAIWLSGKVIPEPRPGPNPCASDRPGGSPNR